MIHQPAPSRRREQVSVAWRLPVGVSSILTYFVKQLRAYPHSSAATEDALRQALARRRPEVNQ
jgi:hypothetical protein